MIRYGQEDASSEAYSCYLLEKNDRDGFTLIEVIAVLVILGILAAFAIPKFVDFQEKGRERVLLSALAVGQSTLSSEYARYLLENGETPDATSLVSIANSRKPNSSDFEYNFSMDGADIFIEVRWKPESGHSGSLTREWVMP